MRAALYVAASPAQGYTSVREISEALGIPFPFLAKIAQSLTQAGILRTLRGPTGGVALARPVEQIRLREIVVAIDGPGIFTECVLGLPGCGDRRPCPLHAEWADARGRIEAMFGAASLGDIARQTTARGYRLSLGNDSEGPAKMA
jgi:Rrf2 family protein